MKRTAWVLSFVLCLASLSGLAAIPSEVASCTNFATCAKGVRTAYSDAFQKAFKAGDAKEMRALLEILKKSPQDAGTFALWSAAAKVFVDDALAFSKKGASEQATLMAGFREGGNTFGLWDAPLEKSDKKAYQSARLGEALGVLRTIPGGLGTVLEWKRLQTMMGYADRIGRDVDRKALEPRLTDFVFTVVPDRERNATNAVCDAARALFSYRFGRLEWQEAIALAEDLKARRAPVLGAYAEQLDGYAYAAACCAKDETLERKYAALVDAQPPTAASLATCWTISSLLHRNYRGDGLWPRLDARFAKFAEAKDLPKDQRVSALQGVGLAKINCGQIDAAMKTYRELRTFGLRSVCTGSYRDAFRNVLAGRKDFVLLEEILEDGLKFSPGDLGTKYALVRASYACGKLDRVASLAAEMATNPPPARVNAREGDPRFNAAVIAARAQAKDPVAFSKAVAALRPMVTDDVAFFRAVRTAAKELFTVRADQPNYPYLMELARLTGEMLYPEERLVYTCKFLKDAPQTADGALRSGLFRKLPLENRMAKYSVYTFIDRDKELKLVKTANEPPHLAADVEGKEGAVACACDEKGVHIYVKLNDPEAGKAQAGYDKGARAEYVIMTGKDAQWHWNSISLKEPRGMTTVPEWGSPIKGFKIGEEYIRSDVVAADDCYAMHIFVPWVLAYTTLPPEGGDWSLVLAAGWAGQFGALGGGSVHEIGRGMRIAFDLSKEDLAAIRFGCLRQAAAEYRKVRDVWENVDFWNDPHLGDEKFYAEVVKPFVTQLDEVVKPILNGTLPRDQVDASFAANAEALADFRLVLDAKRAAWIDAQLFSE